MRWWVPGSETSRRASGLLTRTYKHLYLRYIVISMEPVRFSGWRVSAVWDNRTTSADVAALRGGAAAPRFRGFRLRGVSTATADLGRKYCL
jgi:hypothetical protein